MSLTSEDNECQQGRAHFVILYSPSMRAAGLLDQVADQDGCPDP
jgi:hypothetical protein